jgi:hypothetical protein
MMCDALCTFSCMPFIHCYVNLAMNIRWFLLISANQLLRGQPKLRGKSAAVMAPLLLRMRGWVKVHVHGQILLATSIINLQEDRQWAG